MVNIKKEIYNYYWEKLEPNCNGYGDPYPLEEIKKTFGITLTWEELYQIFKENGYKL